ncbi:MAG TPA: rRNA adenine dimethyltransferase family protein [Actinocatenispora sp.]
MRVREGTNPSGVHFLRDRTVIAGLVRSAGVGPGDLVVEFGAGPGVITAALAGTGARVLAVERDDAFVRRLRRRFADRPVRVVHEDLRRVPLPTRPYAVVANLPFGVTTAALRRLLDGDGPLVGADLLVEWGLARRLTEPVPRDAGTAWWAARYGLHIARRVPPSAFSPAPRVAAAHLRIRPRTVDPRTLRTLRALLAAAYRRPDASVAAALGTVLTHGRAHRLARSTGISPPAPAGTVTPTQWLALATGATDGDPRAAEDPAHRGSRAATGAAGGGTQAADGGSRRATGLGRRRAPLGTGEQRARRRSGT